MGMDVTVKISVVSGNGVTGAGVPLILIPNNDTDGYKEYASLSDLKEDYLETTTAYKMAAAIWVQEEAPGTVAVATSKKAADAALDDLWKYSWRQLLITDDTVQVEVATAIEAEGTRQYFTVFSTAESLVTELGALKPDRTVALVYAADGYFPAAALVGATAARDAGSFTYKNLILKNVPEESYKEPEIKVIHDAGGICILKKAGDIVTSEGKSVGGEFIDIIDSKDWIIREIEYKVQKQLNKSGKIPYDNRGIGTLEAIVGGVLKEAFERGMIATTDDGLPDYATYFALRSQTTLEERAARTYSRGQFIASLAGAIHNAVIVGELEV